MKFTIFKSPLFTFSKKMKHWNLDIIGYWVIWAGCYIKKTWNLAPVLQIVQKIPENYCPCLYLLIGQVWWLNELWFETYIQKCTVLCTNTCHDVTDLVKNTKTCISWEWNTMFLQNKKILNLYIRCHILRSYRFVAEVTFKSRINTPINCRFLSF